MDNSDLQFIIPTFKGLEEVLAKELLLLGGRDIEKNICSVSCKGDKGFMYKINFCLRTALNVMIQLKKFSVQNADELCDGIESIDWTKYLNTDQFFDINYSFSTSLMYEDEVVKKRIENLIRDQFGKNSDILPVLNPHDPDLKIEIIISHEQCSVFLNSSGESLEKRGYREYDENDSVSEVLAAGMVILSGWEYHRPLIDFMCGSATIPIEAALWIAKIPPGAFRKNYGFEKWKDFDQELFQLIRNKQIDKIIDLKVSIFANEENKILAEKAQQNIIAAGVEDMITLTNNDFSEIEQPQSRAGIVLINTNDENDSAEFYKIIGECLKQNYQGYKAWIFTSSAENIKETGLRPLYRLKLYKGIKEGRLLGYELPKEEK